MADKNDDYEKKSKDIDIQLYYCQHCIYRTNCQGVLKVHESSHKDLVCKLCGFTCQQDLEFSKHMQCHTGDRLLTCTKCSFQCNKMIELKKHNKTHSLEQDKEDALKKQKGSPRICPTCLYKCGRSGNMVRHMRTHTGEKPFSCVECAYRCTTLGSLQRHFKVHTGEKPFFCSECDYRCALADTLREHMKKHTGEKPFICNVCGYKCTRAGNLDRHMRKHTGERPYGCPHCGYKCSQAGNLKEHIKTHTEDKPFFCTECKYKCTRAANLDRHLKIHPGKFLSCPKCVFQSLSAVDFQKHFKTHFQKHRFVCTKCNFTCYDPDNFEAHLELRKDEKHVENLIKTKQCNGEKKLSCTICYYTCFNMNELSDHILQHPKDFFPDIKEKIEKVKEIAVVPPIKCIKKYEHKRKKIYGQGTGILSDLNWKSSIKRCEENSSLSEKFEYINTNSFNDDKTNSNNEILDRLKVEYNSEPPVVCVVCGLVCISRHELFQHSKKHKFENLFSIQHHQNLKHLVCLDCGFSSKLEIEFEEHKSCHRVEKEILLTNAISQ